jgi:hypothetical protein
MSFEGCASDESCGDFPFVIFPIEDPKEKESFQRHMLCKLEDEAPEAFT